MKNITRVLNTEMHLRLNCVLVPGIQKLTKRELRAHTYSGIKGNVFRTLPIQLNLQLSDKNESF